MVAKQWGERAIQRILTKWADAYVDNIDALVFDDWEFQAAESGAKAFRLDLIGVDGQYRIAIDMLHDVPHVNVYGWTNIGPHFNPIANFFP